MKKHIRIAVFVFAMLVFLSNSKFLIAKDPPFFILAPDFKLQDIHQDVITLSSYKENEQPVLLFFWTTWCPFCQKELRVLNDMYAGLVKDGLEVLAIDVGELPDVVDNFTRSYYLAYRVLLDKDTAVARSFDAVGVPTYILINKNGYIVFKDNYFPGAYKELIEE